MTDSRWTFFRPQPNFIRSSSGHTIEILGRAGLRVVIGDWIIEVDSEMLAVGRSLVIYSGSIPDNLDVPRSEILEEVRQGLESDGFRVEVI